MKKFFIILLVVLGIAGGSVAAYFYWPKKPVAIGDVLPEGPMPKNAMSRW